MAANHNNIFWVKTFIVLWVGRICTHYQGHKPDEIFYELPARNNTCSTLPPSSAVRECNSGRAWKVCVSTNSVRIWIMSQSTQFYFLPVFITSTGPNGISISCAGIFCVASRWLEMRTIGKFRSWKYPRMGARLYVSILLWHEGAQHTLLNICRSFRERGKHHNMFMCHAFVCICC